MKFVFLALAAAVLGFMAYSFLKGACPDGRVVANEAECRTAFDAETCRLAFAVSERKATMDYAPFPSLDACQRSYHRCEPHRAVTSGFVPVPNAVCVVRAASGATGTPVYERIGRGFN